MAVRDRAADAVVAGGGLVGCAVARALARRGLRVTLLERGDAGAEASGAAAGMVAPQAEAEGPGSLLALGVVGRACWPAWSAAVAAESGIDPEYRSDGIVYLGLDARDARRLAARARWQRRLGLRVESLAPAALRRRIPVACPRPALALHFPDDHRVNNERVALAAAVAARTAGVVVRERCTVHAVIARRGRVTGVATDAGPVAAPVVVNATGAWAGALALPAGLEPLPVFPVRGQMLVLRAPVGTLPSPLYSPHAYLVPRADGRILLGSTQERAGFEKRVTVGAAAALLDAARRMAPGLADATLAGHYAGLRPGTPDGLPIIGPDPRCTGLFHAAGHHRAGILLAPITGEAIADLVTAGRTTVPVAAMAPARVLGRRRR